MSAEPCDSGEHSLWETQSDDTPTGTFILLSVDISVSWWREWSAHTSSKCSIVSRSRHVRQRWNGTAPTLSNSSLVLVDRVQRLRIRTRGRLLKTFKPQGGANGGRFGSTANSNQKRTSQNCRRRSRGHETDEVTRWRHLQSCRLSHYPLCPHEKEPTGLLPTLMTGWARKQMTWCLSWDIDCRHICFFHCHFDVLLTFPAHAITLILLFSFLQQNSSIKRLS